MALLALFVVTVPAMPALGQLNQVCPLTEEFRYILFFSGGALSAGGPTVQTVPTSAIDPGAYTVTLVSIDNEHPGEIPPETDERWRLKLDGVSTPATDDLDESQTMQSFEVGEVVVSGSVTSYTAKYVGNSGDVIPACAGLKRVENTPPTTSPPATAPPATGSPPVVSDPDPGTIPADGTAADQARKARDFSSVAQPDQLPRTGNSTAVLTALALQLLVGGALCGVYAQRLSRT